MRWTTTAVRSHLWMNKNQFLPLISICQICAWQNNILFVNEQYILERLFSISKFLLIHIRVWVVVRKTIERGSKILINSIPNVSLSYLKVPVAEL